MLKLFIDNSSLSQLFSTINFSIHSLSGIFKPCHAVVPPNIYQENCVYDQCATGGETVALCQAIESYADLCAWAGVPIVWRNNTFCRKSHTDMRADTHAH